MTQVEVSSTEKGQALLALARATLEAELGQTPRPRPTASWLAEKGAAFVTLRRRGELRGCIGTVEAHRSLGEDVEANARSAAFSDPRFPPLEAWELADLVIGVSVLSPLTPMDFESEQDLVGQLRPGVDGLVLEFGRRRGTFLPSVWESLPTPGLFLRKLKQKAGLDEDFWDAGVRVFRYSTDSWQEDEAAG